MHRNYFLFEKQVQSLNKTFKSSTISDCFTHRKEELVLTFDSDKDMFLRIGLNQQTPYMVMNRAQVIKGPRIHFFKELTGEKSLNFKIIPYDKIVYIDMGNFVLKCIFFGRDRNVFLLDSKYSIIQTFKKSNSSLNLHSTDVADPMISPDNFVNINRNKIKQELSSFIMKRIGGFNKLLSEELCFRANLNPELIVSEISDTHWNSLNHSMLKLLNEINQKEVDEDRLELELAIIADRVDVTEECIRLFSHLDLFKDVLDNKDEVGKQLTFILQEMHRETNTIGSKTSDISISHEMIRMKEEIEKLREQIQNLE